MGGVILTGIEAKRFIRVDEGSPSVSISSNLTLTDAYLNNTNNLFMEFVFCCNYTPNVCSIKIEGVFVYEGPDKEEIMNEWKERKRLDSGKFLFVHNSILYRCFVEAVGVSKDINVPCPVPIPVVSAVPQKKEAEPGEGLVYG
ncbi:MAG: hypothetical protein AMQ74_00855 [Candidatus Methanofastidiosum methylothiophilum]|uniref:Uncharacterized protein n=1 Tax=Candidatus Methanofastidiosum methylothiophilum TaxID=1705564 RepID=A0A150J4I3_9EURY|nr:MAG: hypothetical protein AMQ74_00855 [Candidatus Methanofastidiosum methylthiophilus]NMC77379.1 hypothetical protein [Candidatus Methanofastidiosa archaeon]